MGFIKKDLVQVNQETGEVQLGLTVLIPVKAKIGEFMLICQEGLSRLAREEGLTGEDHRVFFGLLAFLDYENKIQITQQELADLIGIKRQNVGRSIKKLVEKQVILEDEKIGRNKTYRLNAFYGWRGKINKEYYKAYEEQAEFARKASMR